MPQSANRLTRRQFAAQAAAVAAVPLAAGSQLAPAQAAAPRLGASLPTFHRFALGAFEVTAILDATAVLDGPWPVIGGNAPEAEVHKLMQDNLLPAGKFQPAFTPVIVNTGTELVLFDTGNGENGFVPRPGGGLLASRLAPAGFDPAAIDLVVLSHGHPDHVGGLLEQGKPLFPNARYAIGAAEYDFWAPEGKHAGDMEKFAALFRACVVPLAEKTRFLKPGGEVVPGIRAVDTSGHTPGHLSFHIESEGKSLFVLGDCAHHHVASLARPGWHCAFDTGREKAALTRSRIFAMLAAERIPVSAYHMPFPSLGYVVQEGAESYRWLPHSYQLAL